MDGRRASGALLGAFLVVLFAACGDDSWDDSSGVYGATTADCAAFTACGTCTPAPGCGWCYGGSAGDYCTTGPDQCPQAPAGWTWDLKGCRDRADAGVAASPADAGGD